MEKYYNNYEISGYDHLYCFKNYINPNYNKIIKNIFNDLNKYNCFTDFDNYAIAGGFLVSHIIDYKKGSFSYYNDIDIFIYSNHTLVTDTLEQKIKLMPVTITETQFAKTYNFKRAAYRPLQIVKLPFKSPSHMVHSFDLDISKVLFNGKDIYVTKRFINAYKTRKNIYILHRQNKKFITTYNNRLTKYKYFYGIGYEYVYPKQIYERWICINECTHGEYISTLQKCATT